MPYKNLAILTSPFVSGAEISFLEYLQNTNLNFIIALPESTSFDLSKIPKNNKIVILPLQWFIKKSNPLKYIGLLLNILHVGLKILHITRKEEIRILYSNSFRSFIYTIPVRIVLPQIKNICHLRDNIPQKLLFKFLFRFSDEVVCISNFIYNQVQVPEYQKSLIYNGIDTRLWKPEKDLTIDLQKMLGLDPEFILVAQIAQITPWKNQKDTICLAEIVSKKNYKVHFLLIGSPYSKIDRLFKEELEKEITRKKLQRRVTFIDFKDDIRKYFGQIDILIHPSLDEPFGRVILEAMALEKPIVAYNCGGPKEIIINNKTGFLVEKNYGNELAEKTILLIENGDLRKKFGEAGRKIVEQKFGMINYVNNMDRLFKVF